ncbi:NADPH oxidase organizer 1a [Corythoichthys intestinalis]|uniref:NADPH oxidase organizer 1a n=1 Tax=Corythoichthys intestinalis TaxID=161448 RepID=UPI0025A54E14|nr:NADPH oxidase organizer 1a [Corythoichthys intestinalis]
MSSQRYPISIRLTGVMEKDKKKMYITSVLWSDEEDIVIYRSVEDFKKMHKLLKKAFPGTKKSERIVPKFKVTKPAKAGQKNGGTKSLNYLKPLQKYCNELLSCDPQVNQSVHLIQFLNPKNEELQPEYSMNSIIITPPESQAQEQIFSQGGNVTQPFATETYRCVAPYETKDTKNKPFKVALNEKVDVLIKDKAGWWLVENEDKCLAWFPAPYLERTDDEPEEDDIDGLPERGLFYTVTKSYKATNDDEITVSIGVSVEVLQKSENGWWLIRHQGKAGYIPSMYLKPPSHGRMLGGHHGRSNPTPLTTSTLAVHSQLMSRSQENLRSPNSVRPTSPNLLQPQSKQLSKSAEVLSQPVTTLPISKPAVAIPPKARPVPPRRPQSPDARQISFPKERQASPSNGRQVMLPIERQDSASNGRQVMLPNERQDSASNGRQTSLPNERQDSASNGRQTSLPNERQASPSNTRQPSPSNAMYVPTPIIMVENDADSDLPHSLIADSEDEFTSDSDFSSDEFSSSSPSTSLSMSTDDYRLRRSRTPEPPAKNTLNPQRATRGKMMPAVSDPNIFESVSAPKASMNLSMSTDHYRMHQSPGPSSPVRNTLNPESAMGGKMMPAVSDPNIFKNVSAPRMPPRPQSQEILTRCTTITRKNASRSQSPTPTPIQSR